MVVNSEDIRTVVVIGAGTMGHGIAQVCAMAGCETRLVDVDEAAVQRGLDAIRTNLDKGVKVGKVSTEARNHTLANLTGSQDLAQAAHGIQLAIEAVPEIMDLKRNVFRTLDQAAPANAILATNTSSLKVSEIAEATERPDQVAGLHFFNPVHIMRLVEIIQADKSSEATVQTLKGFSKTLGKDAIVARDVPGFATSRLGIVIGNEAMRMVEEDVASPRDIDIAMKLGYGHPMGPFELSDLIGLDVRLDITEYMHREFGRETFEAPEILRRLVKEGKLGRKSGEGFYKYD